MKSPIKYTLFSLLCVSLLLVGCHKKQPRPHKKQSIALTFPSDPPSLDPTKGGDVISSTIQFMLFEGLTKMTKESSTAPALAKSIQMSADKKTYIFLLKSVKWSDGTPIKAQDFVYAWKQMLDPNYPAPNAHLLYPILNAQEAKEGLVSLDQVGIKAKSDKLLVVTLAKPTPYFLELTSFCSFFPIPSHIAKDHPNWADRPGELFVTNGPFKIDNYTIGHEINLIPNEIYHNKQHVTLESINVKIIEDSMTALHLFEKGAIDFMGSPCSHIPSDSIPYLKKKNLLVHQPLGASSFFSYNVTRAPFNNLKVRKALSYAINRQSIVDHVTQVDEEPSMTAIPQVLKKVPSLLATTPLSEEDCQSLFKQGLEEMGITKKQFGPVRILINENELPKKVTQAILASWKKTFGIDIVIDTFSTKTYLQKLYSKDYDIAYCSLVVHYNDAMNILERFKHRSNIKNYAGWENTDFIKILDDSFYIHNHEKRMRLLEKAEAILLEEMPFAPIYHWNEIYLESPDVKNIFISPVGSAHFEYCKRV